MLSIFVVGDGETALDVPPHLRSTQVFETGSCGASIHVMNEREGVHLCTFFAKIGSAAQMICMQECETISISSK